MSGLNETEILLGSFMSVVAIISILCSLTTLTLIHRIGKWSGYLLLVYSLTVCQLIYDFSFLFFGGYHFRTVYSVIQFLVTVGGVGVALWSNILSVVVLHIVTYHSSLDIGKYYIFLFAFSTLPALGWAIYCVFSDKIDLNDSIYNYFRFLSILINYLKRNTPSLGPLKVLSSRFKYYPICQVLIRTPAVIYQYSYGFGTSGYRSPSSTTQFVSLIFYAMFAPIGGIAYFIVFLCMQPQAKEELQVFLRAHFSCLLVCYSGALDMVGMQTHALFLHDGDEGEIIVSHLSMDEASEPDDVGDSNHTKHPHYQKQQHGRSSQNDSQFQRPNQHPTLHYSLLSPGDRPLSASSPSPERLSEVDVCYSPLSDSSFSRYQHMDDDELAKNMLDNATIAAQSHHNQSQVMREDGFDYLRGREDEAYFKQQYMPPATIR